MKNRILFLGLAAAALVGILFIPVGGVDYENNSTESKEVKTVERPSPNSNKPDRTLQFLFIHHSCGGQLLAPVGNDIGEGCVYESHPNGGGLRDSLQKQGYEVHEVSYGSELGDKTDIFDWLPKFRQKMDKILKASGPDTYFSDGTQNNIVAFKSCFPNSRFTGSGTPPGNPEGPELTVANAQAAYSALLNEFSKHPEVLFVAVTAPPLLGRKPAEPIWKQIARVALGKQLPDDSGTGVLARKFNDWLSNPDGWLKEYPHKNVAVFDYFNVLTDNGKSDFLRFPSGANADDNHPSKLGNTKVAEEFVPFLNSAVEKSGILVTMH